MDHHQWWATSNIRVLKRSTIDSNCCHTHSNADSPLSGKDSELMCITQIPN